MREIKVDSSMDRHALQGKDRDDRETSNATNPNHTTQAAVFCDDFASFQGAGAGILLSVNEQARAVESSKSAQKTTPNPNHTTQAAVFCDDFASFQGAGAGILLSVNEQARAVESSKSAQKTTRERRNNA